MSIDWRDIVDIIVTWIIVAAGLALLATMLE
jgi:hypothetical protein